MRTRTVYIANLPPLLQDMVREQFVDDCHVNVLVDSNVDINALVEKEHLDLLMLPTRYKKEHLSSVYAFLRNNPCSRVLFIGQNENTNEVLELTLSKRQLKQVTQQNLRDLFYNTSDLCSSSISPCELN